jgi:hypothetical protein
MPGTMIEVDRAGLIAKLEATKKQILRDNAKDAETYPARLEAWNLKVAGELRRLADRMNGKPISGFDTGYRGSLAVPIKVGDMPTKPRSASSVVCEIDRMIAIVQLVNAETFKLRSDDRILVTALPDRCRT